jgi:hypothetical protein
MTTLDPASTGVLLKPPHVPLYSSGVRMAAAVILAAIGLACLVFDWPFAQIGVFQPMMIALGFVLIQYVVDIPFRITWLKLAVIGVFVLAALSAWLAWYSGGSAISQDAADAIWKVASVGLIAGLLAAGVWNAPYKNFHSKIASIPMMMIVLFAFIGCALWTITYSTSRSGRSLT